MLTLPPRLFPTPDYYVAMSRAEGCVVEAVRYDKRDKAVHRFDIVDARSRLQLTVPVAKPHGIELATWADVKVSRHDRWWERHVIALESAYGRTPYFEFLIDRFKDVFRDPADWPEEPTVMDLIRAANEAVCDILAIDRPVYSEKGQGRVPRSLELRVESLKGEAAGEYWQVRRDLMGFVGGLSVLDIIFNLGPEATTHLGIH